MMMMIASEALVENQLRVHKRQW